MIGQEILDEIKNNYKQPRRIRVTPELMNWLELDPRLQYEKIDNVMPPLIRYTAIPVVVDKELKKDYEIDY